MKAIGYIRWSTLEQGNSNRSSEERQRGAISAYCKAKDWPVEAMLVDSGKSAFTGANLKTGELGTFSKRVLSGAIDASQTVLVVEELDRLSRRPPGEMTSWIMPLLTAGLTVAIANTGTVLTNQRVNDDFGAFVTMMSAAFSAYEFSRKQQARGVGAWEKVRRVAGQEGRLLSRHRGRKWLAWNALSRCYEPIPERVALIQEMFQLRLAGQGKGSIAKLFNERAKGEPAYAPWQSTSISPRAWTTSAVSRIVQDPAVTGYIQFHRSPRGAEKRTPIGELTKVYPEVIDQETFARANDERLLEQLKVAGRGRSVSNLLGPLARCGTCRGTMQPLGSSRFRTNKDGSKSQHYFLYCLTAKMSKGKACSNQRGWAYSKIETPILDTLLPLALDDQFFRASDDAVVALEGQVAMHRRKIVNQTTVASNLLTLVRDADGDTDELAMSAYADARVKLKQLKADLDTLSAELSRAQGRTTPTAHVVRVSDVRSHMKNEDEEVRFQARATSKLALKALIEAIYFDPKSTAVAIHLRHGLGLMLIRDDGKVMFFNLHKRGVVPVGLTSEEREQVQAYERRTSDVG